MQGGEGERGAAAHRPRVGINLVRAGHRDLDDGHCRHGKDGDERKHEKQPSRGQYVIERELLTRMQPRLGDAPEVQLGHLQAAASVSSEQVSKARRAWCGARGTPGPIQWPTAFAA